MKPTISFVIPVYNAEKYLKRCIKSIQKQSYKDFEIICVNDGSTDNSLNVLKEIQSDESRMKIIDQENGVMDSRKRGAIETLGKYIWFIDDDDEIYDINACRKLIEIFEREKDVQIIQFATLSVKKSIFRTTRTVKQNGKFSSECLIKHYYKDFISSGSKELITPSVWDKIYTADLIKEAYQRLIDVPTGAADLYLNLYVVSSDKFKNIYCTNEIYYKYYSGIGSYSRATITFLKNYSNVKRFQEILCKKYTLPEDALYYCHLESIYYLFVDIKQQYYKKVPDNEIIDELTYTAEYECIIRAKAYFNSRPREEISNELFVLATATPLEYLNYVKSNTKKPPNILIRELKKLLVR